MDFLNQVTQGVAGLQNIQVNQQEMQMRQEEMQRQQKKQTDEAKAAEYLAQYQASEQAGTPDFTSLNKAILLSPTASQNVLTGIGIQDKRQKTQAASDVVSLYAAADSPDKFKQLIANRIQTVRDRGGDPKDSIELANIYETQGAEAARKSLQMVGAALANEGFVKADMIGLGAPSKQAPFQQGSGEMSGLVFNPNTGTYSVNQEARKAYTEALSKKDKGDALGVKDKVTLNKEISAITKDATMIHRTAQDIEKLKTIKSGPAAISIVYKFMKSLDPTSVVREGEFAIAENAAGVPETIANVYNKLLSGERLPESVIADFSYAAKELANTAVGAAETEVDDYLATFEDDLGAQFSKSLRSRVPKRFEIEKQPAQQPTPAETKQPKVVDWSSLGGDQNGR